MEKKAFEILESIENSWWDFGRQFAIEKSLTGVKIEKPVNILDFGAGYGSMQTFLSKYGLVDAYEPNLEAIEVAKKRGYKKVFINIDDIKKNDEKYSLIVAFDVIEHVKDDIGSIKEIFSILKPGGVFVITVPAFQFLWSKHDVNHKHFRRYTKFQIISILESAGFQVIYSRYWNVFLFPIVTALRLLNISGSSSVSSRGMFNDLMKCILKIEANFIKFIPLPFGVSVVVSAKKPE